MPTPNSSMSIAEYEEIVNEYTHRVDAFNNCAQSQRGAEGDQSTTREVNMINNLLIVQRQHNIRDPLEAEMDFWMQEIEDMERKNKEMRGQPTSTESRDQQPVQIEELKYVNKNKLIFVPEDWMENHKAIDNAFEHMNENFAEVTSMVNNEPIQVKRKKKPMGAASARYENIQLQVPPTQVSQVQRRTSNLSVAPR